MLILFIEARFSQYGKKALNKPYKTWLKAVHFYKKSVSL
jgi:hypothetical protein